VDLRLRALPPGKKTVTVLDAFSADGRLWHEVQRRTKARLSVTRIERKGDKAGVYMKGDNRAYLKGMNTRQYDIIDLDAFGIPYDQLEILWPKLTANQTIVFTYIQGFGQLPKGMLMQLGITPAMYKKVPILFCKNGFEKLKAYLSLHRVREVHYLQFSRKVYGYFRPHARNGKGDTPMKHSNGKTSIVEGQAYITTKAGEQAILIQEQRTDKRGAIRSSIPLASQVKGTMFEPRMDDTQIAL